MLPQPHSGARNNCFSGESLRILIVKLAAAGDVLRTTPLLDILRGEIHWLTNDENLILLTDNSKVQHCVPWSQASVLSTLEYDLVLNLEDSLHAAEFLGRIKYKELFGSYLDGSKRLTYTDSSQAWFDLSLISRFGKKTADKLKFENRRSYQEIVFAGLGRSFHGEQYLLPKAITTDLTGDIAIATRSGPVWPMKDWAYYNELKSRLEGAGYKVNILPLRRTVLEHMGDVQNHKYLISGDSLPMHIALGSEMKCVTIFQCTSPWEIYDYGLQTKIVSPLLGEYFYKRNFAVEATTCIRLNEVYENAIRAFREG